MRILKQRDIFSQNNIQSLILPFYLKKTISLATDKERNLFSLEINRILNKEDKKETVYVIGHANPDADSICSAIVYAGIHGYQPRILNAPDKETLYILKKFNIPIPEIINDVTDKTLVLIDHNSKSESALNLKKAKIKRIIDHHRADMSFSEPIDIEIKPVGATATLIAEKMIKKGIENKDYAGILLSAIISDTLGFISPTTTKKDVKIAKTLIEKYQFDINSLIQEIMNIKSDIEGIPARDLLKQDGKMMNFKGRKIFISQIIDNKDYITKIKPEMLKEMERFRKEKNLDAVLLMQTNTFSKSTNLLVVTKPDDIAATFGETKTSYAIPLKDVVSRKHDVVPKLDTALNV